MTQNNFCLIAEHSCTIKYTSKMLDWIKSTYLYYMSTLQGVMVSEFESHSSDHVLQLSINMVNVHKEMVNRYGQISYRYSK